jgi:hypothetical protein
MTSGNDEFTVPLCRGHHREVHRQGDEAAWWKKAGIDPTDYARAFWIETHPLAMVPDNPGRWHRLLQSVQIRNPPAAISRSENEAKITKRTQSSRRGSKDFLRANRGQP